MRNILKIYKNKTMLHNGFKASSLTGELTSESKTW